MKKLVLTLALFSVLSVAKADHQQFVAYDNIDHDALKEVTYSEVGMNELYFKEYPSQLVNNSPLYGAWIKDEESDNSPTDDTNVWHYEFPETFRHPRHIHSLKSINQ